MHAVGCLRVHASRADAVPRAVAVLAMLMRPLLVVAGYVLQARTQLVAMVDVDLVVSRTLLQWLQVPSKCVAGAVMRAQAAAPAVLLHWAEQPQQQPHRLWSALCVDAACLHGSRSAEPAQTCHPLLKTLQPPPPHPARAACTPCSRRHATAPCLCSQPLRLSPIRT